MNSAGIDQSIFKDKNIVAWTLLTSALAVHVFDEAVSDFLPFYNQLVLDIRAKIGFFPMPTFSFDLWLGGLILVLIIGFALIPIVHRGRKAVRVSYTAFGILMILNACGHMIGSIYFERILPGFWSSPLLLAAAVFVVVRGLAGRNWRPRAI